jgi:hypothetical protein
LGFYGSLISVLRDENGNINKTRDKKEKKRTKTKSKT